MDDWSQGFFDADYLRIWRAWVTDARTEREADGLWAMLDLAPGRRVLDAPCGFGRLARALARRGALVLGVDRSAEQLDAAERERGDLSADELRYKRHDLRTPLDEGGFDAALNVFTSLGYTDEADDLRMLAALRAALRPGGALVVETMQRDAVAAAVSRGAAPGQRLPDGTLVVERPVLDPVRGRVDTVWYWSGPAGHGEKRASMRVYTVTELVALVERAGFVFERACAGCSPEPFRAEGPTMGGRVAVVARRPA